MTSGQHIDYDALQLEALRGVVKACLAQVSRTGLVGEHHFYIAFNTQAPSVGMSKRLKEKYPLEMTIVLQHRFWDLVVDEDRFEVKLTFDGIPERLVIPFAAVKVFYDPSVPFVLQFEEIDPSTHGEMARRGPRKGPDPRHPAGEAAAGSGPAEKVSSGDAATVGGTSDTGDDRIDRRRSPRRTRSERLTEVRQDDSRSDISPPKAPAESGPRVVPARPDSVADKPVAAPGKPAIVAVGKAEETPAKSDEEKAAADAASGAKIFDLSKFRGKK